MKAVFVVFVLALAVLLGDTSHSQGLQNVSSFSLRNGMKMYVAPDNRYPIVAHMLIYKVGGVDDPPGLSGLAHFVEHLMFTGTKKFGSFSEVVHGLGGQLNAFTSSTQTVYYNMVDKQHLALIMEMEADRMSSLNLQEEYIERERNIVREERNMRTESTIRGMLIEEMVNVFYKNGYGRPVVGWDHEISNYNKESVESFYQKYYNPENAILLIVGDVDPAKVFKLAQKYYGRVKNRHQLVRSYEQRLEPPHRSSIVVKMEHPTISSPELYILYSTPSRVVQEMSDTEYCAAYLAVDIVSGHEFGALYSELVKQRGLATDVSVSYSDRERSSGMVALEIMPRLDVPIETVSREVKRVIEDLKVAGVSEELVKNAQYRAMAKTTYALDGIDGRAWAYANVLATEKKILSLEDAISTIKSVTVEDVNAALRTIFEKASVEAYLVHADGDETPIELPDVSSNTQEVLHEEQ